MSTEDITSEIKEANKMLDSLEDLTQWCATNAAAAMDNLQEKWKGICVDASSTESDSFLRKCEDLLSDCAVFQNKIVGKARYFMETAQVSISVIEGLASDNDQTSSISQQIVERWNKIEQPQLMFLYDKLEELETSIRDMMPS